MSGELIPDKSDAHHYFATLVLVLVVNSLLYEIGSIFKYLHVFQFILLSTHDPLLTFNQIDQQDLHFFLIFFRLPSQVKIVILGILNQILVLRNVNG